MIISFRLILKYSDMTSAEINKEKEITLSKNWSNKTESNETVLIRKWVWSGGSSAEYDLIDSNRSESNSR